MILNNLQLWGLCCPCLYILFLISLPPTLPRWAELMVGAIVGLIIDIFSNTLGVNMAACLLISYIRPLTIKNMIQDNDRLNSDFTIRSVDFSIYLRLVTLLVVIHHTTLFSLEAFSFTNWWFTLLQIIISSVTTILLILLYEILTT